MKTRCGYDVRIFDMKSGGEYPVLGAYFNTDEWIPVKWDSHGRFPSINESVTHCALDIIDFEDEENHIA